MPAPADFAATTAVFPGREDEVSRLLDLFRDEVAGGGGTRMVLVHGPAGMGKGHLLSEARRAFRLRGELVLDGDWASTPARPYQAFATVVEQALAFLAEVGAAKPSSVSEIESLWAPPPATPREALAPATPPADDRLRFFDGVRQFLTDVSRIRPLVILLRDLHRADEASADLFAYLAESLDLDPTLAETVEELGEHRFRGLVLSSVDSGELCERLLSGVVPRSPVMIEMPVAGLDADGVRAFLSSPAVVERILRSTAGRPEGLEDLIDLLPDNIEDLYLRRLAALEGPALDVVRVLAVAGGAVPGEALGELAPVPPASLGSVLGALVEQRLVTRAFDGGTATVALLRPAYGEAVIDRIAPTLLGDLHGRVAQWLDASADRASRAAEDIAGHYLLSASPEAAWPHVLVAVERLTATYAFGKAADLLGRALALAPPSSGADRAPRLETLCDLHEARGDVDRALFHSGRLKRDTPRAKRGPVYLRIGRLLTQRGDLRTAGKVLERAASTASKSAGATARTTRLRIAAARAEVHYLMGEHAQAEAACEAALGPPRQGSRPSVDRIALRNTLGKVHLAREDVGAARRFFSVNLDEARAGAIDREEARALINLGIVRLMDGDHDGADGYYEQALEAAERTGDAVLAAMSRGNLAVSAHRQQRYSAALEHYHRCIVALRKVGNHTQLATAVNNLGDLYLVLGAASRARKMADFALAAQSAGESRYGTACNQLLLGDIAVAGGHHAEAARCFDVAHGIFLELGGQAFAATIQLRMTRLAIRCGRTAQARKLLDLVADSAGADAPDVAATASLLAGELAAEDGRVRGAATKLRASITAFEQLHDLEGQWRAHLALSRVLRCEGRPERGMEHLERSSSLLLRISEEVPASLVDGYMAVPQRRAVADELSRLRIELGLVEAPSDDAAPPVAKPERRPAVERTVGHGRIIGGSERLERVLSVVDRVARSDSTVLLLGESGTGKELVAQAIHEASHRPDGPFIRVNCAAFVETLLLSELFGHEKGAFTGAVARRRGRFELADGGTLFLDEIGDVSPKTQVSLLRVLQEREFERVGGAGRVIAVDVRVVCATNRDLDQMVRNGEFRMDLYYRLKGVAIELPALRDREGDIELLADHFLADQRLRGHTKALSFSDDAVSALSAYAWPGNVRELENVVRSVSLFSDGDQITAADLAMYEDLTRGDRQVASPANGAVRANGSTSLGSGSAIVEQVLAEDISLAGMKKRIEIECILAALRETGGNITRAAQKLQMKRPRLSQIIKANIDLERLQAKEGVLE